MATDSEGFGTILYSKVGPVARVTLNRPRALNAYSMAMRDELWQVLQAVQDDPEVGAVVLTGEGRAFCAGADLTEFGTAPSMAVARRVRWERDMWGLFLAIEVPLVAAVHGYCLGAGLEIALLCDLRLCTPDAVFGLPEVGLGMIPAAGGTQTLPRTLGPSAALKMVLARERLDAAEALRFGLVMEVVPLDSLVPKAMNLASRLASLDPRTVRATKRAVLDGMDLPLEKALDLEARLALAAG